MKNVDDTGGNQNSSKESQLRLKAETLKARKTPEIMEKLGQISRQVSENLKENSRQERELDKISDKQQ